jgi:hypothetical protein
MLRAAQQREMSAETLRSSAGVDLNQVVEILSRSLVS